MPGIEIGDAFFSTSLDDAGLRSSMSRASKSIVVSAGVAAAAILAIGTAAVKVAGEVASSATRIVGALGLLPAASAEFEAIITDVYGAGFGKSLDDAARAVQEVGQQLRSIGVTNADTISDMTRSALLFRDTWEVDINKTMNASKELMDKFGLTSQESLDFVALGLQQGLNASGDFLDSIGEYSTQFSEADASADQFFSVMQSGLAGGMLGTDRAADAFAEFGKRIRDGSDGVALALDLVGINSDRMIARLGNGSLSVVDAFTDVQQALERTRDKNDQMQAGVALLGSQFEDLGASTILSIDATGFAMSKFGGSTDILNEQLNSVGSRIKVMGRGVTQVFVDIGRAILPVIEERLPILEAAFETLKERAPSVGDAYALAMSRILDAVLPAIEDTDRFSDSLDSVADTIGLIGDAISVALPVMRFFGGVLEEITSGVAEVLFQLARIGTFVTGRSLEPVELAFEPTGEQQAELARRLAARDADVPTTGGINGLPEASGQALIDSVLGGPIDRFPIGEPISIPGGGTLIIHQKNEFSRDRSASEVSRQSAEQISTEWRALGLGTI